MPDIDDIAAIKEKAEDELLKIPGVTGVGVGYKYVNGQKTDELAIRVNVDKKTKDVPPGQMIPPVIDGVKTDVIEKRFTLQGGPVGAAMLANPDATRYDPLVGGISIGPCRLIGGNSFAGTMGLIVTDVATHAPLMLSNFHVLCVDNGSTNGADTMVQPSQLENGVCPQDVAGVLQRSVLGGPTSDVDCAVASVVTRGSTVRYIKDIGAINGSAAATLGQLVKKRGRTSGLTVGTVEALRHTQVLDYGDGIGSIKLINQIWISNEPGHNPVIGEHGDSGAAVVNPAGQVVGLYYAGADDGSAAMANPIASVLSALAITI